MEITEDFLKRRKEFVVGKKYFRSISVFLSLIVIGILGVVVVGQVLQPKMVPLLDQPFASDEQNEIMAQLQLWQQRYELNYARILVPVDERLKLIGRLGYVELLPENISKGINRLISLDDIVFMPAEKEARYLIIKQELLARCIEGFPGVENARVFFDNTSLRRIFTNKLSWATASVQITTSSSVLVDSKLATTIADFVSSTSHNMRRENISVANDQPLQVAPEGQSLTSSDLELKSRYEQYYREKIISILSVPNALVQIDVGLESYKTHTGKGIYDILDGQEPGTTTNSRPLGNRIKDIKVAVLYPMSFFRRFAKLKSANKGAEPTEAEVQAQVDLKIPELHNKVLRAIGLDDTQNIQNRVVVGAYWDDSIQKLGLTAMHDQKE